MNEATKWPEDHVVAGRGEKVFNQSVKTCIGRQRIQEEM